MSKVYVKFPKAGLGNLMLVWGRACVFAHLNNLTIVTSSWWGIRLGAWIRNEKRKRFYWRYFKESSSWERAKMLCYKLTHSIVNEPPIQVLGDTERKSNKLFLFNQVNTDNDLFGPIRGYQKILKNDLYNMLNPLLCAKLNTYEVPVIAIHIRRGDFKVGNPITPESFYINCS